MEDSEKIFIQIASYRDPQLVPTLRDCLSKARNPENLIFSIAWQHSIEDLWDNLDEFKYDNRFKIIDIDYKESKGACWARNTLQKQYSGEKYTLQLDSHHRFIKDWDFELKSMYNQLKTIGYDKPLLTAYLPSFNPDDDPGSRATRPWKMNFDRFIPEGAVFFLPGEISNYKELDKPIPSRFYSAHFCFTSGDFVKEVPHDPEYYFHGEEISITVRAYTWGYDLFHPHKVLIWHEYTRKGRNKQWDDDPKWHEKNTKSHMKNKKLFEMDGYVRDVDFGEYDFGKIRTLRDYEEYAGISFGKRSIQKYTFDNQLPPNPRLPEEQYNSSFIRMFKHCIDVHKNQFIENDYDFWAVIFENVDGTQVYREDLNKNEIRALLSTNNEFINIWRTFKVDKNPDIWIVWAHSESRGWCERVQGTVNYNRNGN